MSETVPAGAREEFRRHWPVVLAGMAGTSLGAVPSYGLGLFIHPLETDFGWSRAGISAALTIYAVVGVVGLPAAGMILDRLGSRRVGLAGVALYCVAIATLALVTANIWTWWAFWVLIGFAGLWVKPSVWSKAITSFFTKGRGVALACMASGTGVAAVVLPTLNYAFIEAFGWRGAFVALGLVYAVAILPIVWFAFFDSTDKAMAAEPAGTLSRADRLKALPGWTGPEGLRKRQTWQITAAAMIATGVITAFVVHLVPILSHMGMARGEAVSLVAMVGLLAVASRIGVGYIFDRVSHPAVGTISIALPVVPALILLFLPPTLPVLILAVVAVGIAIGGEYDAVLYLSTRYFGLKAFGFLFGIVGSALLLGIGVGPVLAGHVYDVTGSYDLFMLGAIPACLVAAVLLATLGRYPDHRPTPVAA